MKDRSTPNLNSSTENTQPSKDLSGDQLSEIFDAINQLGQDLRSEMRNFVKIPTFEQEKNHNAEEFGGVKKRLDALEAENKRLADKIA